MTNQSLVYLFLTAITVALGLWVLDTPDDCPEVCIMEIAHD